MAKNAVGRKNGVGKNTGELFGSTLDNDSPMFGNAGSAGSTTPEEPPLPENYDVEDDDSIHSGKRSYAMAKRDVWDEWLLRKCFNEGLETYGLQVSTSRSADRLSKLDEGISALTENWTHARRLLGRSVEKEKP
jgi:hypothetical protein